MDRRRSEPVGTETRLVDDFHHAWILLVGGARQDRGRLELALTFLGANVVSVATAWEAARVLTGGRFDLAVVDVDEPDPDGDELVRAAAEVPLVAVSAAALAPGRLPAGRFAGGLIKPIYPEAIVRVLAALRRRAPIRDPVQRRKNV